MTYFRKILVLSALLVLTFGFFNSVGNLQTAEAQTKPLTYSEIITALNTKLPNAAFTTKTALISWLISQINQRKVEKSLSPDTEAILRQSGATDELIKVVIANVFSPPNSAQTPATTKNYAEMSDSEKNRFIESKANEFLNKFGRTETDKIPAEGVALIKTFVDGYLKRLLVDDKTLSGGNDSGMVSKNNCFYARGNLADLFRRGNTYSPAIIESFEKTGVQPELGIYVAFLESEFCPCIQAPTGLLGMFQLPQATGALYGLKTKIGAHPESPDERCMPKSAAQAAASYLKTMSEKYYGKDVNGTLFLIAAYNSGEAGMNRNIATVRKLKSGQQNVTFWDLVENRTKLTQQFQSENYRYVPKFLAAVIIGENPKSFGLIEFQPLSAQKKP